MQTRYWIGQLDNSVLINQPITPLIQSALANDSMCIFCGLSSVVRGSAPLVLIVK